MLFRAEGVVTAAGSRHVQAGCRDYTAQENLWAVRTVCGGWRPPQGPPSPSFCFSATQQQVHSGSKDEKQLGFIAAKTDHKSCTGSPAVRQHVDRNVPCVCSSEQFLHGFVRRLQLHNLILVNLN